MEAGLLTVVPNAANMCAMSANEMRNVFMAGENGVSVQLDSLWGYSSGVGIRFIQKQSQRVRCYRQRFLAHQPPDLLAHPARARAGRRFHLTAQTKH